MAKLELKNIGKAFGQTRVLEDINLSVEDKEFIVLVGPSGCGKSTVLRLIAGLEEPTEGDVLLQDATITGMAPKDRDMAMVFQNYALYPHMSVYDNMAFGLKMRNAPEDEIKTKVTDASTILDLDELLDRKPKQLSGGQRQRVALGRAIVRNPKVFLMDEPLSNLDAKLRVHMRSEISKLHQKLEATTIYVTHDQVEAMTMGSRIVILHEGKIQQVDAPSTVYDAPANLFVAGFIGHMNFLTGILQGDTLKLGDGTDIPLSESMLKTLPDDHDGRAVVLGVRPEHALIESRKKKDVWPLEFMPERVEMLGSELLVYGQISGDDVVVKLPAETNVTLGETLALKIEMARTTLFDAATTERIA